jgi:hypothetical protein
MSGFQYEPDHGAPRSMNTQQQLSEYFQMEQPQKKRRRPKSPAEAMKQFVVDDIYLFFTPVTAVWEAFRKNLRS